MCSPIKLDSLGKVRAEYDRGVAVYRHLPAIGGGVKMHLVVVVEGRAVPWVHRDVRSRCQSHILKSLDLNDVTAHPGVD